MTHGTLPEGFIKTPGLHAYLVLSPDSSLRREISRAMAKSLLCSNADKDRTPCNACSNCIKMQAQNHPDCFVISGIDQIKVEDVRHRILDEAYLACNEADCKVFILEDVDLFNVPSQNVLLKIVEEPPKNVVFVLTASSLSALLPTVRSRVCTLNLGVKTLLQLDNELKEKFPSLTELDRSRLCAFVSSYDKTQPDLAFMDKLRDYCRIAVDFFCGKDKQPVLSFPKERDQLSICLQVFMLASRDIAARRCGITSASLLTQQEIYDCCAKTSLKRAVSLYDVFEEALCLAEENANVNATLAYLSRSI